MCNTTAKTNTECCQEILYTIVNENVNKGPSRDFQQTRKFHRLADKAAVKI